MLHVTKRLTIKEVIQMHIDFLLVKDIQPEGHH